MNKKKIAIFISITFFINWLMVYIFYLLGGKWGTTGFTILGTCYMFIPMIVAIIVQKGIYKQDIKVPLAISFKINKFWFLAWFLPLLIVIGSFAISLLMPSVEFSPDLSGFLDNYKKLLTPEQIQQARLKIANFPYSPILLVLYQTGIGFLAGITVNAVAAFGEELGWRGFLFNEFKEMNFWGSSLIVGSIWGVWHFPLILFGHNYPQHPQIGVVFMIFFCILLAPIFSFIRMKAHSVIATAILHGTINGTAGAAIMLLRGGNDLIIGFTGLAGFIILLIINIILYFTRSWQVRDVVIKSGSKAV